MNTLSSLFCSYRKSGLKELGKDQWFLSCKLRLKCSSLPNQRSLPCAATYPTLPAIITSVFVEALAVSSHLNRCLHVSLTGFTGENPETEVI